MEVLNDPLNNININTINMYISNLKSKLMYLENPDTRLILSKEYRLNELKNTTINFKKFIQVRHQIISGKKYIIIPYISLNELYIHN